MLEGQAMSRAAYDRFEQIYSNVRARYDAENRASRTVADSIKVRIAAFLSNAA
jgi:LPS-assembly lipoprotein